MTSNDSQLIIQTKFCIPHLTPDIVSRQRLLTMMDGSLEVPLTLVSAPAGYGKSPATAGRSTGANGPRPEVTAGTHCRTRQAGSRWLHYPGRVHYREALDEDDSDYKGIDPDELKVLTDYFYEAINKAVGDAEPTTCC